MFKPCILDLTEENAQIRSLFSMDDWNEIIESFNNEVRLVDSDVPDAVMHFFDEIERITKADYKHVISAIEDVTPGLLEKNRNVTLSDDEKDAIGIVRRAIITYAENLGEIDLPVSEAAFDNAFPNILAKRFLDKEELRMEVGEIVCWASAHRRNEGRSVVLRARVGQKCDFRGTLKNSFDRLEAIIGLRSGGLPDAHRKKVHEDRVDLAVAMRDILYGFFASNSKAPEDDLHSMYVLGMQSWGWNHDTYAMDCKATNVLRFGRLSRVKLPSTMRTLACLEGFYALMSDVRATLRKICDHANNTALAHSRAYRHRKRKNPKEIEIQGGLFGSLPTTPLAKRTRGVDDNQT